MYENIDKMINEFYKILDEMSCKCSSCKYCIYYEPNNFKGTSLSYKLFGVRGFCRDKRNPDFNDFARVMGRGIARKDVKKKPNWCRFKKI